MTILLSDIIDTALAVFTVIYNIRLYSYVRWAASGARARVSIRIGPDGRLARTAPGLATRLHDPFGRSALGFPCLLGLTGSLE